MTLLALLLTTIIGSLISLIGGVALLRTKRSRGVMLLLTLPLGAGALLGAAFFDLLPEAFHQGDPEQLLIWALGGFTAFFLFERGSSWFHHHHEHGTDDVKNATQRHLIITGDLIHNAIDGIAIGAAFLVSIPTGIITAIAVGAHEIPKELGTFAVLLSRGWKDKTVLLANVATAAATVIAAVSVYYLGLGHHLSIGPLLAVTAGFFIYIAASDIIPDIHEQPRRIGSIQAVMLLIGILIVAIVTSLIQH